MKIWKWRKRKEAELQDDSKEAGAKGKGKEKKRVIIRERRRKEEHRRRMRERGKERLGEVVKLIGWRLDAKIRLPRNGVCEIDGSGLKGTRDSSSKW